MEDFSSGGILILILVPAIFYWAIKAALGKDPKVKEEILKPFPYILVGSIICLVIRNRLLGPSFLLESLVIFMSFFLLSFVAYAITTNYLNQNLNPKMEENHLKGLIVAFLLMLIFLFIIATNPLS